MIEVYSEDEALTPEEEAGIRTACEAALELEGAAESQVASSAILVVKENHYICNNTSCLLLCPIHT